MMCNNIQNRNLPTVYYHRLLEVLVCSSKIKQKTTEHLKYIFKKTLNMSFAL